MSPTSTTGRHRFRAHPLDGAVLYFQPTTGTSLRIENDATRDFVRTAPRVAMFGATNICNLRCGFCSRDVERRSEWTVASAATLLEGLAEAGVLEVAFGGGEPFAFRGFDALLERLFETTALALNVTTNGTLLRADRLERLRGILGQVRLSIYDDVDWRAAGSSLGEAGQRWGANILVDAPQLELLPSRLRELARLGARDVSLLSYVGNDAALHLSQADRERLVGIVAESPLPIRVSVCFGDTLRVATLFDGADGSGDCGAGVDFVSISSDRRIQSCSFKDDSFPISSADDVLQTWRAQRDALSRPATRAGCTRRMRSHVPSRANASTLGRRESEVRVWQGFSGNNSGECVMVARFAEATDVTRVLAELLPGYVRDADYPEPWLELFRRERVNGPGMKDAVAPEELAGFGRVLVARTEQTLEDDFPELRALAWKRGGVVRSGLHVHDDTTALIAVRAASVSEAKALANATPFEGAVTITHGITTIAALALGNQGDDEVGPLAVLAADVRTWAKHRPHAVDFVCEKVTREALIDIIKRLGTPLEEGPRRLGFAFWGLDRDAVSARAARLVETIDDASSCTRAGGIVLVDPVSGRKRLAVIGHRAGAHVFPLESREVMVGLVCAPPERKATKGRKAPEPPPIAREKVRLAVQHRLRGSLGAEPFEIVCCDSWWSGRVYTQILTANPRIVLAALDGFGIDEGWTSNVSLVDTHVVARVLRAVLADLDAPST